MDPQEMIEKILKGSIETEMAAVDLDEAPEHTEHADTLEARYHLVLTHLTFLTSVLRDFALGSPFHVSHLKSSHDSEVKDALAHTILILHAFRDDLPHAIKAETSREAIDPQGDNTETIMRHILNAIDMPFYEQSQPLMKRLNEKIEAIEESDDPATLKQEGQVMFDELKGHWDRWLQSRKGLGVGCIGHKEEAPDSDGHRVPGKGEA